MTRRLVFVLLLLFAVTADAQLVRITLKPAGIVHGDLLVPVSAPLPVTHYHLYINGVKWSEAAGQSVVFKVHIGEYLRRLRIRVVGLDRAELPQGEDEMVVNDPRPPFRVHLVAPAVLPEKGTVMISANVLKPADTVITAVELYVGEEKLITLTAPPYEAAFDAAKYPHAVYTRVVARAADGAEANDVVFFGTTPRDEVDVTLQQIPLSIASGNQPLRIEDLDLNDDGKSRRIETLVPAADQPLYTILLIDYSESMLEELPVVKAAARGFAQRLLRSNDRIAVVGFNQPTFWLTGWTNDAEEIGRAVERAKPRGETHLYDAAIEMLFELQKHEGRHALVILTDGVDQGSKFQLEHLVHYARYAGIPVYPIIKNKRLTTMMRFGVGRLEARKLDNIARDTGATYFIIQKESELPGVYAKLADELRQQYQLIFYSDPAAKDEWHSLAITDKAGLTLRIPKGYFP